MKLVPTATLTALTANNTSASDHFKGNTVGAIKPGNVSDVKFQELLPNPDTKAIIHLMPWWKPDGWHDSRSTINVGYSSDDPKQVAKQLADMKRRGGTGIALDWYGPGTISDRVLLKWKAAAEADGSFEIIAQPDSGIYKGITNGPDAQKRMLTSLDYIAQTYFPSKAYTRYQERPVLPFFINNDPGLDWPKLKESQAATKWMYIFRDRPGFSKPTSDGSFAWIHNLDEFYALGKTKPGKLIIGSICPGFDNTLAPWGNKQIIPQNKGQHWLDCFALARKHFNATTKLWAVMGVTWNDYEEGSEFETGLDGSGNPNTVHHLEYYASLDGENLMPITQAQLPQLDPGTYKLFTRQVGMPSIVNVMSQAVDYVVATPIPPKPVAKIVVSVPATLTALCPIGASSDTPIERWEIWIDGAKAQTDPNQILSVSVPLKQGVRRVVVQAITKDGQTVKEVRSVNVA